MAIQRIEAPRHHPLWVAGKLYEATAAYILAVEIDISNNDGRVTIRDLADACRTIVAETPILRTTFEHESGRCLAVVHERNFLDVEPFDPAHLDNAKDIAFRKPFNLDRMPLARFRVGFNADGTTAHVLAGFHHLVFDEASLEPLQHAFRVRLEEGSSHHTASRFDDTELLDGFMSGNARRWDGAADAYAQELRECSGPMTLPFDRPMDADTTSAGGSVAIPIPGSSRSQIAAACEAWGCTPWELHLSVLAGLLAQYRNEHFTINIAMSTRDSAERPYIGCQVNALPLPLQRFSAEEGFARVVDVVRTRLRELYLLRDLSGLEVMEHVRPWRLGPNHGLFQVAATYTRHDPVDSGRLVRARFVPTGAAKCPLLFGVRDSGDEWTVRVDYQADLFDHLAIEQILTHYRHLLSSVTQPSAHQLPDAPSTHGPSIVSASERERLLAWGSGPRRAADDRFLHVFGDQVRTHPAATACDHDGRALSYSDLDDLSTRIALALRDRGVQPGDVVAVSMGRTEHAVATILGVWKARAVYLPLDPGLPEQRRDYILSDSTARLVVHDAQVAPPAPSGPVVWPAQDLLEGTGATVPPQALDAGRPNDRAYLIYTSGTTGQPQGVAVDHRGLANLTAAVRHLFDLDHADRVLQFASWSFDASIWELVMALGSGAQLVLTPDPMHVIAGQPKGLHDLSITTVTLPVTAAKLIDPAKATGLRRLICAGEPFPPSLLETWADRVDVYNAYGPTEATVCATLHRCRTDDADRHIVPIGHPLPNVHVDVLDHTGRLAPTGVVGEVVISGPQVARYHDAAEARSFRENPHRPGWRSYWTGDLARWSPRGDLEFHGRADRQLKVRGHRVEPAEIERRIQRHPDVDDAVVVPIVRDDQHLQLAAFVKLAGPRQAQHRALEDLRVWTAAALPSWMLPQHWTAVDAIPTGTTGKINQAALTDLMNGQDPHAALANLVHPSSRTAAGADIDRVERLRSHFSTVLGTHVDPTDDFFELGGDSILAVSLVAEAATDGFAIRLADLFEHSTPAGLATVSREGSADQEQLVGPCATTPIIGWYRANIEELGRGWTQRRMIPLAGPLHADALSQALADVVAHHDALRLRLNPDTGNLWFAGVHDGCPSLLTGDEAVAPAVDPELGPTVVGNATRTEAGNVALDLAIHHLCIDAVSWRILAADLRSAYQARLRGAVASLPAKTTSYRAWADYLVRHGDDDQPDGTLRYWTTVVAELDEHRPATRRRSIRRSRASLTAEPTRALAGRANDAYRTTVEELLLASLAVCWDAVLPGIAPAVQLENHGRPLSSDEGPDLGRTIGWMTASFPYLLPHSRDIADVIVGVKESRRAVPTNGHSFAYHAHLRDEQHLHARRPQVAFNYYGAVADRGKVPPVAFADGPLVPDQVLNVYPVSISAWHAHGRLFIELAANAAAVGLHDLDATVMTFIESTRRVISHCLAPDTGRLTPSDFPLHALLRDPNRFKARDGGPYC